MCLFVRLIITQFYPLSDIKKMFKLKVKHEYFECLKTVKTWKSFKLGFCYFVMSKCFNLCNSIALVETENVILSFVVFLPGAVFSCAEYKRGFHYRAVSSTLYISTWFQIFFRFTRTCENGAINLFDINQTKRNF